MDVVLLCIEQQLEGLDLAGDVNLVDFGAGVVQPPSQWCLDSGTVDFCLFLKEHVSFARQRLLMRGKCFSCFLQSIPLFQVEELEGPFYSLSFFCLFDLYLGYCSEASISGMEILEVDWECLGSFNSRVSDQPHSENNSWD